MKYYFIKETITPNEKGLERFPDAKTTVIWTGKGEYDCTVNPNGDKWDGKGNNELWDCEYAREKYGYKRLCDANRVANYKTKNEEYFKRHVETYWNRTYEVDVVEA